MDAVGKSVHGGVSFFHGGVSFSHGVPLSHPAICVQADRLKADFHSPPYDGQGWPCCQRPFPSDRHPFSIVQRALAVCVSPSCT